MTTSNEHPDMSGNPCDEPVECAHCCKMIRDGDEYSDVDEVLCYDCAKDAGWFDEDDE